MTTDAECLAEIRECPFCGGKPALHENDWCEPHEWSVHCLDCGGTVRGSTDKHEVINVWNRRLLDAATSRPEGPALHASAPDGCKCSDCTMDGEACPTCYDVWWQKRHPHTHQLPARLSAPDTSEIDKLWEIAHQVWHAMDDSEDRDEEGQVIPRDAANALWAAIEAVMGVDGDIHDVLPRLADAAPDTSEERVEAVARALCFHVAGPHGSVKQRNAAERAARAVLSAIGQGEPFQQRVDKWIQACFGAEIGADRIERNHRFFEESTEAVQANGMTRSECHQLVDYTFDRPLGELGQEVGGVLNTLAALCTASGVDMDEAGEIELRRVWGKVEVIRAKQAAKPKHSQLPAAIGQGEDLRAQELYAALSHWYEDASPYSDSINAEVKAVLVKYGAALDRKETPSNG